MFPALLPSPLDGSLNPVVVISKHQPLLDRLGLSSLAGVRAFQGERIKDHRGRRDIFRIQTTASDGRPLVLFLKRSWKPYRKDGLASLIRQGRVWSVSRQEWENSKALEAAGLKPAELVAYGEECGPLWEKFSFLITERARGSQTLQEFLQDCRECERRRRVLEALALEIRKLHDAGLATPDLFTRHVFVEADALPPQFSFIDLARLDRVQPLPTRLRARDLAALSLSAPRVLVSARERLRFLRRYAGVPNRPLAQRIAGRMQRLSRRSKFREFRQGG